MNIVIIGGGFAGIAAAKKIYKGLKNYKEANIELIDKNEYTTMLPSLPDVISGKLSVQYLYENIKKLIPSKIKLTKMMVEKIDLKKKLIYGANNEVKSYDKLIIASGSITNFYGFDKNKDKLYTLDSIDNSLRIREDFIKRLNHGKEFNVVIAGGGFTGLAVAGSLYYLAKSKGQKVSITLVERAKELMGRISPDLITELKRACTQYGFDVRTGEEVVDFDGNTVFFKNSEKIENAFFCWCTGVKIALDILGDYKKLDDGRIVTDDYLKIPGYDDVYAAGDSAAIMYQGNYLRRAVNFSFMSGLRAGTNLAREIQGKQLKKFNPIDLGWVLTINFSSVGESFGIKIKGYTGVFIHYMMCGVKNYSLKNLFKYVFTAIKFMFKKKF